MQDKRPYRPRLVVEIPEETHLKLQKLFPHGLMKPFFNKVVEEVIQLVEVGGVKALGFVIAGSILPSEVLPSLTDIKEGTEDGDIGGSGTTRHNEHERGGTTSPSDEEEIRQEESTGEGGEGEESL